LVILVLSSSTQFASPAAATSPATPPNLGTAAGFGVLSAGAVSNTGSSKIAGNLGVDPSAVVVGFPPGVVTQTIFKDDAVALQAKDDLASAFSALGSDSCTGNLTHQNLGGLTLTPGVYCFSSAASLSGTLTLNTQGSPSALYIFQIEGSLTISDSSSVTMTSGSGCNVFWQVGGSAVLGTQTAFAGSILSVGSITMGTGANITGAAMTQDGSMAMSTNHVASQCSNFLWEQQVSDMPVQSAGCFEATYPVVEWVPGGSRCVAPPTMPEMVGGTSNDYADTSSSTKIGEAEGYVSSAQYFSSETDTNMGANYYSLDDTTNTFTISAGTYLGYTGGVQFIFVNDPGASAGYAYVQYWLLNYYDNPPPQTCPSGWSQPPRSTYCYMNTTSWTTSQDNLTGVTNYVLKGYADHSGYDETVFCDTGGCYASTEPYTLYYLSSSWTSSTWNLLGYGFGSGACINGTPSGGTCPAPSPTPSLAIVQNLDDSAGNSLSSISCTSQASQATEWNSLTLGSSCSPLGGSSYFTET
jgi:hypothetical protein